MAEAARTRAMSGNISRKHDHRRQVPVKVFCGPTWREEVGIPRVKWLALSRAREKREASPRLMRFVSRHCPINVRARITYIESLQNRT